MIELHEISRVVMPTASFVNNTDLFLNTDIKQIFEDELINANIYKFNTWMNMFAANKYYKYCSLGDIYLKLDIEGKYTVLVTGSIRTFAYKRIDTILIEQNCENNTIIKLPECKDYDGIYFTIIENCNCPIKIKNISWCTDIAPLRDNKIAVICCTFKRENYVKKNIELFEQFKSKYTEIKDKINLFISDNGKTLPLELNSENVKIYPNINAGGAGGFTRGVIEVMKLNQGYTRVLFMDDDVEFFTESFYRTLMLSNYLKPEYEHAIINGSMLDLYKRNKFYESIAIQTPTWVKSFHDSLNLNNYNNVLKANVTSDALFNNSKEKVSSAWWFCSYTLKTFEEKGLPISLFFRCDDIEYSWRNFGKTHIQINGICVWHAPFKWRSSKVVTYYYSKRNYFMINMIHTKNYKKRLFKTLCIDFKELLKKYDYISCEIYLKMMQDLLIGAETFKKDPEEQFKELNEIEKQRILKDCDYKEMQRASQHKSKKKFLRKLMYKITNKAKFAPDILFKKSDISLDNTSIDFMLRKEVRVYNLLLNKCEVRKYDSKKISKLKNEFKNKYKQLQKKYSILQEEFIDMKKEMENIEYWNKYLKI